MCVCVCPRVNECPYFVLVCAVLWYMESIFIFYLELPAFCVHKFISRSDLNGWVNTIVTHLFDFNNNSSKHLLILITGISHIPVSSRHTLAHTYNIYFSPHNDTIITYCRFVFRVVLLFTIDTCVDWTHTKSIQCVDWKSYNFGIYVKRNWAHGKKRLSIKTFRTRLIVTYNLHMDMLYL